jgi:hypothetical protein
VNELKQFNNLTSLDLVRTRVTDAGLKELRKSVRIVRLQR